MTTSERNQTGTVEPDFAGFDQLVAGLARWSGALPEWPPAARVRAEWEQVEPRLERARRELSRVLVVGVVGGTGTGKSTLVNALAGADVTEAGDVARPTTVAPVVVAARDVDLSWLPVDTMGARVVRSEAPAVANIVLIDCPDPDTQPAAAALRDAVAMPRPSDANRNRELLEAVLPSCDVLLLVATAQKYRSWIVAREVQAFAPGRPLLFVQTHAGRDPDIRADWARELEAQGFSVPRIFRLDGVEAARRTAAGLEPEPGFRELTAAIDDELVGRAARRVRRTGARPGRMVRGAGPPAARRRSRTGRPARRGRRCGAGPARGDSRPSGRRQAPRQPRRLAAARHRRGRRSLARRPVRHVSPRARGAGRAVEPRPARRRPDRPAARRSVARGGGRDRRLAGGGGTGAVGGRGGAVAEHPRRSRRSARLSEPLVGRARLDAARVPATAGALLERTGHWLATGIDELVTARRGRAGGPLLHWIFEALFGGMLVAVIGRAGWKFFHDHLWLGRPMDGGGFLQEAIVWLVLWGLLLRWVVFAVVRSGLERDITALVGRLPAAKLVDPLLADFTGAAARTTAFLEEGDRLGAEADALAVSLAEPAALGRLRGAGS